MLSLLLTVTTNEKSEEKFNKIYNEYINLIFYIASGFFDNQQDKEDAVYETFLKIVSNLEHIGDDKKRTKNFVSVVTKNTCITMKNKQCKLKQVSFEDIPEYDAVSGNLQEDFDNKTALEIYKKCLLSLPENYYEIIYLKFYEELSNREIAKLLGISEDTCYQRLHRARGALKTAIKEAMQNE